MSRSGRWATLAVPAGVAVLAVWSLIPFGAWWAGVDIRYFRAAWATWLWGTLIAAGIAIALLVLTRGRVSLALVEIWRRYAAAPPAAWFVGVVAAVLALLAVLMCVVVFSGNPRNVDGFAQLFQARIFLAGRLWAVPPPDIANFATLHVVFTPRWFSQYPPGQSLVLAAGLALGAWWLLNPLFAALLVWATWRVARWCADEAAARLAVLLLCISPFVVAVSGSEISHLPAAALGMAAAAAATSVRPGRGWRGAALAGAALGAVAMFRPLDAVAAAAPVALILILAAPGRRGVAVLAVTALAGAVCTVPTLWYNRETTGRWLEFGYNFLWGPGHSLGFHPVPWGVPLTPLRAVGLTGLDLHQLNRYLFDAPFPILVLIALGLVAGRRHLGARDAVSVAGVAALSGLLFFYWHRDWFYGPRFLFTAVPWVVILLARGLTVLRRSGRETYPGVSAGLAAAFGGAVVLVFGLVAVTPGTVTAYARATPVLDLHPDRAARRAGISHAVVVIPDGWGQRLIARMWALGVPPVRSTRLYAAIDACTLERALDAAALDSSGVKRAPLGATLDSLAALGRPGAAYRVTQDPGLRLPADSTLPAVCGDELLRDASGFLEFSPFLYLDRPSLDGDIVWARDLARWNAPLFARYPDRALYRYAPHELGGRPGFSPLERAARGDAVR
ncbi:MAG TPA: hypothetical protein VMT21_11790 [Gemmatimonadales bacterium]|nr:hypothetical protein [Gemmatimonadales bacterium]